MIDPIRRTITVTCDPATAFRVFTDEMATWWPLDTFSRSADEGGAPVASMVFDHEAGGTIWEVRADGGRASWGEILAWEPPTRLVMAWKPHDRPVGPTEVEVTFTALEEGGTRVDLEHRGWERLGDLALEGRENYASGWPMVFDQRFADAANGVTAGR